MGVGLEGVLLTSHLYPCTQSMVPYSGDNELGATWPIRVCESLGPPRIPS
jgi:hypothetical protein